MSTDFDAVCFKCRKRQHIGQRMSLTYSFGYGSNDQEGSNEAAKFALEHADSCGLVAILETNSVPELFLWIPTDPMDKDEPGYGKGGVEP